MHYNYELYSVIKPGSSTSELKEMAKEEVSQLSHDVIIIIIIIIIIIKYKITGLKLSQLLTGILPKTSMQ